jgi:DUF1680 family protein
VYCIEQADHGDIDIRDLVLPATSEWEVVPCVQDLPAVRALRAVTLQVAGDENDQLYRARRAAVDYQRTTLTAIHYFAWANRTPGPMRVWIPTSLATPQP